MSPQSPDLSTAAGAAIEDKSLDKESVIELLGDEPEETEVIDLEDKKDKGKTKDKTDDKSDKEDDKDDEDKDDDKDDNDDDELTLEDEIEEELREPEEDELEQVTPPRRKEILAAYPDIFKKFPQLERSMYREQRYSELLPTIKDAEAAVEKSNLLDSYEKEIMNGSTESLLTTVKDNDKEAFAKVVDNYLPNLYKVDQAAYYHTIANITKHTIMSMVRDSKENGRDELAEAAAVLNEYMFGTTKFSGPQSLSQTSTQDSASKEKEEELSRKEREFLEHQFNTARDNLGERVDSILKTSVDKFIDPNNSMTPYVKKVATREVLEGLEDLISKDTRFRSIYDKLWERAFSNNFDKESMDRIKSAYLSKAKTLLPDLIKKSRNEALKGLRRTKDNDDKDRKGPLPVGKTRSSTALTSGKSNKGNESKSIPRGMTTLEYLNSDD